MTLFVQVVIFLIAASIEAVLMLHLWRQFLARFSPGEMSQPMMILVMVAAMALFIGLGRITWKIIQTIANRRKR